MNIVKTKHSDLNAVTALIARVSESSILPYLSDEGRSSFSAKVLSDIETAFKESGYQSLKIIENGSLVGFGAIRDQEYITHLFIDSDYQGSGFGKLLLTRLLSLSNSKHVCLKASVNSVSFYESQGFKTTDSESDVGGIRFVPMCIARE